jgi:cytochrome c oxidase subunit III
MATTVTSSERVVESIGLGRGAHTGAGGDGNGFRQNGGGRSGGDDSLRFDTARYRIGMWMAVASILMLFTALTSAYIVRAASANDWRPLLMPKVLWLSTTVILISSATLERARRALRSLNHAGYSRWLVATVILGICFLGCQLLAWRQLVAQGIYMAGNPHSSFFYLLTGAHGVHLLGGVLALNYLLLRTRRPAENIEGELKRSGAADAVSIYWHFMDGLWIGLFLLLFFWG